MSKELANHRDEQIELFARAISIASSLHALNLTEYDNNDVDQVPPEVYDIALRIVGLGCFADRRAMRLAEYSRRHTEHEQIDAQPIKSEMCHQ